MDVDRYKTRLLTGTKKTKTKKARRPIAKISVVNILTPLGSLMRYAVANDEIDGFNLNLKIKSEETELEAITNDDFQKLLGTCEDQRYRVGLMLARNAGLRVGEVRALRWSDINEKKNVLVVRGGYDTKRPLGSPKSGKPRTVPLSADLLTELKKLMPADTVEWSGNGTILRKLKEDKPLSYWATRDFILKLYERAGVDFPRLPWHCLRHAFCTGLAEAGVPIHTIKDLAGHASIETTLRYVHSNEEAKQDAIGSAFGQGSVNDVCPNPVRISETEKRKPE